MTLKIFLSILITSAISVGAGIWLTFSCGKSIKSLAGIFFYIILVVCAIAVILSKNIVKPVRNIDLNNPKPKKSYKELFPLLEKLKIQNGRVNRQRTEIMNSREQFSTITESMKEGIIIADSRTVILACNSGAYRLLGINPLEKGQSIYAFSREEVFRRCIQDAMGGRNAECLLKTEMGDRKIIASPASVAETVNGIVVFILDVTEQQKLETMRREFTSNVSHELKTPLTTIYGIADMLANGMVKPEDSPSFGKDIRNEAERLISLIDDIVSLSKLDEDSIPRQDESVDLYNLSEEILSRLNKNAVEKNISSSLSGEHITVTGNRTILDEIIYNLCDNAIKYNVNGGEFEVKISHVPTKAIITVSDTGTGIADEHIERIFERFYRADKSRSGKIKGTGLGLSIVKHGVSYHGGTVRATSSEKGSSFIVELPIKQ
ncbi:MAG: ATP-binding protein [Ruminococcus flavefaciens]|nr:ATP-binding protein [Ruminococcus flavefaciens]MCM1229485.1 ATP-binding protein [Ruminococcus flavefaciens]